ncbi:hypothetical protein AB205_0194240 [Aquarana catesbeiana]|uniref:Uncharacterized protein n=1 Tax=Aquarana catesbeiana TaxID=8400 RepID=A0A2G9SAW1_AQUCT|nr:hypothetical protein AB205_0194240 [Aquarana catesbeiana]
MCETCPKKVSIPAWLRELIMSSTWNSAQTDNCTPLTSNVSHSYFCPQNIGVLSIPFVSFS